MLLPSFLSPPFRFISTLFASPLSGRFVHPRPLSPRLLFALALCLLALWLVALLFYWTRVTSCDWHGMACGQEIDEEELAALKADAGKQ
jgi:hypothetical protein